MTGTEYGSIGRELWIDASPEVVFEVVSRPEHLREWWPDDARLDAPTVATTGTLTFGDPTSPDAKVVALQVAESDPPDGSPSPTTDTTTASTTVDIRHRVAARVPLAEVHAALATADDIARWWTTVTIGDGALGGLLVTRFADPDGVEIGGFDLRVTALEPTRIQWQVVDGPPEWIGTRLTFDLATEVDGAGTSWTVVLFTHTGWREPGDFMSHCSTKWATFLLSLRDLVETGSGRPAPDDVRIGDWH